MGQIGYISLDCHHLSFKLAFHSVSVWGYCTCKTDSFDIESGKIKAISKLIHSDVGYC